MYFDQEENKKPFLSLVELFFLFPCLHSLIQTFKELREFSTFMQTLDCVSGLHNSPHVYIRSGHVNKEIVFITNGAS